MRRIAIAIAAAGSTFAAVAQQASDGSGQLHQAMMKASQEMQSMQMTGDVDHDFVAMMRKHHEDAIAMAKIELQSGKDETAKKFARETIQQQQKDIAKFEQWLSKHGAASKTR